MPLRSALPLGTTRAMASPASGGVGAGVSFLGLGIGRIGQGQQRGGAVARRRVAHEMGEHRGRRCIRDGDGVPGRVRPRRQQHIDGHARQSRRIHDDQPVDPLEMLLQRLEPLPRQRLGQRASVALGGFRVQLGAEALRQPLLLLGPGAVLAGAGEPDPDGVAGVAQQAGPVLGILIDPADEGRTFGESLLGGFERGGLACEGLILALELLLQLEQLAAELAPLVLEVLEELVLLLGECLEGQELADAFIEGLGLAEQAGLAVVLRGGERSRGAPGHLVDEAAGQPLLPARPGVAWLPARARAMAKKGSGDLPAVSAASSPFAPRNRACS